MVFGERELPMQTSQYVPNNDTMRVSINRFDPIENIDPDSFKQTKFALSVGDSNNHTGLQNLSSFENDPEPTRSARQSRFYKSVREERNNIKR